MKPQFDNSYEKHCHEVVTVQKGQNSIGIRRRHLFAFLLAVLGAPIGAILCSVGYTGVIMLLETVAVPPLRSPSNYGQFGFLVVYFGFVGLFYGASFGLIPYTRFFLWFPFFILISGFAITGEIATDFDVTEVTCAAMIIVGIAIIAFAAATSFYLQRSHIEEGSE